MRGWVLLATCCACGRVGFDPLQGPPALDDSGTEAGAIIDASIDARAASCNPPGNGSDFPDGTPCGDWGASASIMLATISQTGGQLVLTPNPNTAGAQASCTRSALPFGTSGTIVEVTTVLSGGAITAIQLGGGATALSMVVQNGMLLAQDASGTLATTPFSASTRFWRIRPGLSNNIVFDYSDGLSWNQFAISAQTPQTSYTAQIIAGEIGAVAAPGSARFDSVNLCP